MKGSDGRLQARSVSILGANPKPTTTQMRRGTETPVRYSWRLPLAVFLLALVVLGLALGHLPWLLAGAYTVLGLVTFAAYGRDKRSAETGQWRTSEVTLLGLDLWFGIVGGLIGQDVFRHKTRKPGYIATTLLIAGVHLIWLGGLGFGFIRQEDLFDIPAMLAAVLGQ